jgi:hypothetical protein
LADSTDESVAPIAKAWQSEFDSKIALMSETHSIFINDKQVAEMQDMLWEYYARGDISDESVGILVDPKAQYPLIERFMSNVRQTLTAKQIVADLESGLRSDPPPDISG